MQGAREAIVHEWLDRVLAAYPEQTARFYRDTRDPFRNPVGRALREGLPVLLEELDGGMNWSRIAVALDGIVRIRAVQDLTPAQAVGFLFALKPIVAERWDAAPAAILGRIDELALKAFDLYVLCREEIFEIRANEAKRRDYVMQRIATREAR